jgi:SAM-dependent methyltransferase
MAEPRDLQKAALRGEPSYVWRDGQKRRMEMVLAAADDRVKGPVLEDGCGVGMYLHHLSDHVDQIIGLDVELARLKEVKQSATPVVNAVGEFLPFPADLFSLVLSHEVLEHVSDDRAVIKEIVRTLKPGGRLVLFCPNRGYPFETHGVYWREHYHFGNIPLVNYLPDKYRNRLAPHVKAYTKRDLEQLFEDLPVRYIHRRIIFGAYDNIIARAPGIGKIIRSVLQFFEKTPFRRMGLSHFWVVEKV